MEGGDMMKKGFRMTEMFAFTVIAEDMEGIPATMGPEGWMPLVGADAERIESFRPIAQMMANETGKSVKLVKFTHRQDVEEIKPNKTKSEPEPYQYDQVCPTCGYKCDSFQGLNHSFRPMPGFYSLCLNCGEFAIFDETLKLRVLTEDQKRYVAGQPDAVRAREAWQAVQKKRRQ